ncbi:hypothetical protein [Luteimonas sp. SDU101]|uniref:hypothetical protein n=1 Tax=unclassified Luteimonas TaxID=2629088 RepID=UPI003EBADA57
MRLLVVLTALAMPIVAWLSNTGAFGPDQGTISDRYPTLLVAAGYAFSIWSLIFLLDLLYAFWQASGERRQDATLGRIAPWAAAGFFLTTMWMPLFSQELFWLCLLVIFGALACLAYCAVLLTRDPAPLQRQHLFAWLPLSLHAGWLTLAAFLNLAQVMVAYEVMPVDAQLPWALGLYAMAAVVLLVLNHRMRGNVAYAAAALWALVAVYVRQSGHDLAGSDVSAWIALAIAVVLCVQTAMLRVHNPGGWVPAAGRVALRR